MIQQLIYGLKVIQCLFQRGSPNANIVNGTLYVVGGDMNDRSLNVVESYDPIANRWTTHTPMSTSRHHAAFCGGMWQNIRNWGAGWTAHTKALISLRNIIQSRMNGLQILNPCHQKGAELLPPASTDPFMYWVENGVKEHLIIMNDIIRRTIYGPSRHPCQLHDTD